LLKRAGNGLFKERGFEADHNYGDGERGGTYSNRERENIETLRTGGRRCRKAEKIWSSWPWYFLGLQLKTSHEDRVAGNPGCTEEKGGSAREKDAGERTTRLPYRNVRASLNPLLNLRKGEGRRDGFGKKKTKKGGRDKCFGGFKGGYQMDGRGGGIGLKRLES